jgi:N6-L-threonylcarbamoyladenine synthase
MKILAIETSCDDTAVSLLQIRNSKLEILSNVVASQIEVHQNYGGVFPMMAKREHQANLVPVLTRALKLAKLANSKSQIRNPKKIPNSKFQIINSILKREPELLKQLIPFLEKYKKPDVDLIAVTNGPGLEPCLWVGVNFAKTLSYYWDIPIVPVNHIEAHILVNFIDLNSKFKNQNAKSKLKIQNLFPAVSLVVSGGHTQLVLMRGIGKYKIIGETRDDAAGECFDKCAKILGLGYPGGPEISRRAEKFQPSTKRSFSALALPRPMINSKDYDFSFSGLKTAVLYLNQKSKIKDQKYVQEMCVEIQQAIVDVLIKKTLQAAKDFKVKAIILGGGVSANSALRAEFEMQNVKIKMQNDNAKFKIIYPPKSLSTDNALMIAVTGYYNRSKKIAWQNLSAHANLRIGK